MHYPKLFRILFAHTLGSQRGINAGIVMINDRPEHDLDLTRLYIFVDYLGLGA